MLDFFLWNNVFDVKKRSFAEKNRDLILYRFLIDLMNFDTENDI